VARGESVKKKKRVKRRFVFGSAPRVASHETPWHPPVVAFWKGSVIREAYAKWWQPEYHSDLSDFLWAIGPRGSSTPEGLDETFMREQKFRHPSAIRHQRKVVPGKTIKVRIVLDYPLREKQERVVEVSTKRFGEIFGIAHDMYRDVYKRDAAAWKKKGHKAPPIIGKTKGGVTLLNRRESALVWGHDMGDLAFESMHFEFDLGAKAFLDAYEKARKAEIRAHKSHGRYTILHPKISAKSLNRKLRFDTKKYIVGTVTFGIGS
jgi:hypothetical protein